MTKKIQAIIIGGFGDGRRYTVEPGCKVIHLHKPQGRTLSKIPSPDEGIVPVPIEAEIYHLETIGFGAIRRYFWIAEGMTVEQAFLRILDSYGQPTLGATKSGSPA